MAAAPVLTRKVEWNFLRFVRGLYWPEGPDAIGAPVSKPLDPVAGIAGTRRGTALFSPRSRP
jgi:hypothetical protein